MECQNRPFILKQSQKLFWMGQVELVIESDSPSASVMAKVALVSSRGKWGKKLDWLLLKNRNFCYRSLVINSGD